MSSPFSTKEFKKLQAEWNKRLKKEGFEDIEQADGNLKLWDSHKARSMYSSKGAEYYEARARYYQLAGQFLHDFVFPDEETKLIWELHADGMSYRNIIKTVKSRGYSAFRDKVQRIIGELRQEMVKRYGKS